MLGRWHNELGSCMDITAASEGQLTGMYETAVGDAKYFYQLTGRYDCSSDGRSLGWIVTWNNSYGSSQSTTGWSGQYQIDPVTSAPQILTTWLLTAQTKPGDDWNSTHVGFDTFTRELPRAEVIEKAKRCGQVSHPKGASCTK